MSLDDDKTMKQFRIESLRGAAVGTLMYCSICDVTFFNKFRASIKYGRLPWYSIDIFIICIGLLEATMAVFWSWFGRDKVKTLQICNIMMSVSACTLWFLPAITVPTGEEFCSNTPSNPVAYLGMTTAGAFSMVIFVYAATTHAFTRSAIWNHSLFLIEQLDPGKMSIHYGYVFTARIVSLLLFPKFVHEFAPTWFLWLGTFIPGVLHAIQIWRIPPVPLKAKDDLARDEESETHILPSWVVVAQIFAVGLLVAPLWSYLWHLKDILKVAFFVVEPTDFLTQWIDVLYYHAIPITIGLVALKSTKRAPKFKRVSGVKLATGMTMIVTILYFVLTMYFPCNPGNVAGLSSLNNYTQPACSAQCGCAVPFSEFNPVCITDTMTTYFTPCHAGCDGQENIGGAMVFRNCSCAPGGGVQRAVPGVCTALQCRTEYIVHKALTTVLVLCTLVALQGQIVALLKSVRERHRAALIGAVTSVALFLTFPCGHLIYASIAATTCSWFEGGRCIFHGPAYLKALGGVSIGFAGLATLINLATWITWRVVLRRLARSIKEDNDLNPSISTTISS